MASTRVATCWSHGGCLLPQEKKITLREGAAYTKGEAQKWNAAAWFARAECLPAGEGSIDTGAGKWAGLRIVWAARGEKIGDVDLLTFETFDGGANWKNERSTIRSSFGYMPLPDKYADPKNAYEMVKKLGVKAKTPSILLCMERGVPVWLSTTKDEPDAVVHGESGKGLGIAKPSLAEFLDRAGKGSPFPEAMAAVEKMLVEMGVTEWGLLSIDGRAWGVADLTKALHLQSWTLVVESTKPQAAYLAFGYHNGRVSGWNAVPQATGGKTTPASEVNLGKSAGYVAGYPLIVDAAKRMGRVNVAFDCDEDRMRKKEVRVRLIDEQKPDQWCQAILDLATGKVKDFMKQ